MRILLVSAPQGTGLQPVIPLGMLYVAAALIKENHQVEILDLGFSKNPLHEINKKVFEFNPDVTGISIRNIAETKELEDLYDRYREIVGEAKKYTTVVLGGAGFSIFPEEILAYTGADYGIAGEGEESFLRILKVISEKHPRERLLKSHESIQQSRGCWTDIMDARWQHWQRYGKYYSLIRSPIPIQTIRGCNLKCSYCSYPMIQGEGIRLRSPESVVREFKAVSHMPGAEEVFVVDSAMNADYDHVMSIASLLQRERKVSKLVRWSCCLSPINLNSKLTAQLQAAGLCKCELGIDSFSNDVLNHLNKGFSSEQAYHSAMTLQRVGVPYSISLILGAPGETPETLQETLSYIEKIKPELIHAFIGVRLYPETNLLKTTDRIGDNLLRPDSNAFYLSQEAVKPLRKLIKDPPQGWFFSNSALLSEQNKG